MNNRLYRSLDDRVLAGVAGGMAETYDMDPALVRLVWALVIVFTGGAFLIIYVIMALVVPVRPVGWSAANVAGGEPGSLGYQDPAGATPGPFNTSPSFNPVGTGPIPGPSWASPPYPRRRREGGGALIVGLLLVLVGIYLLARQFFPLFDLGRFWPLLLVLFGVVLIVTAFGRRAR